MVARHLDGNPDNNHIDNLCWGTQQENIEDQFRHRSAALVAGTFNRAKLKPSDVTCLLQEFKLSAANCNEFCEKKATDLNVTPRTILNVVTGKTWKRLQEAA
jgi:hypothetical protein